MNKAVLGFAIGAVIVLMGACVPEFENPLPAGKKLKVDKKILGTWYGRSDEKISIYEITPEKNGWMDVKGCEYDPNKGEQPKLGPFGRMYSTKIGKDKFLSLQMADPNEKNYMIINYAVHGDNLTIRIFDQEKAKALITSGELKGTIRKDAYADGVSITSTGEEVANAIDKHGADNLFVEKEVILSRKKPD